MAASSVKKNGKRGMRFTKLLDCMFTFYFTSVLIDNTLDPYSGEPAVFVCTLFARLNTALE